MLLWHSMAEKSRFPEGRPAKPCRSGLGRSFLWSKYLASTNFTPRYIAHMVPSDQVDSGRIIRDMTSESMEVEFLEHIEGKGLSASWPGHHPMLGDMTNLEVMHTGSTLQAFAAERGASICCVPEGAACQGAPPPGRQNMPGAAATADTLADDMSDGKGGQEPSSPPALACTTKSEDGCSSGGQAGEQWPDFSGKSGSKDRSGASLGVRSTSAPLSVVSKTVKETHAERNRQAQRRYRQRQRVRPVGFLL